MHTMQHTLLKLPILRTALKNQVVSKASSLIMLITVRKTGAKEGFKSTSQSIASILMMTSSLHHFDADNIM